MLGRHAVARRPSVDCLRDVAAGQMSVVVLVSAWPKFRATTNSGTLARQARLAHVWRRAWKPTAGVICACAQAARMRRCCSDLLQGTPIIIMKQLAAFGPCYWRLVQIAAHRSPRRGAAWAVRGVPTRRSYIMSAHGDAEEMKRS